MIDKTEKLCCGCGACANICPVGAIEMRFEEFNFYTPIVNQEKCVKCGKCLKVCPALEYKSKNTKEPVCYAVSAQDEERKNSTSGAIFPVIAKYILNKGGYVCGVAWDENFEARHIIINDEKDLYKLRYSKYVQATTGNCFSAIKKLLEDNKYVLFSGTPCQNAGLIKFLGKDYEKLVTVDILCHGTPSPKVWQDYLEKNFEKDKITDINFRNKNNGWVRCSEIWYYGSSSSSISLPNGKEEPIGVFYEAFLKHRLSNEACLECKYRPIKRPADFTLGDFWHFYKNKEMNDGLGLSAVLLNNKKAEKIFNEIKPKFKSVKKINMGNHYNWIEINSISRATKERKTFFEHYNNGWNLNKCLNESVSKHYDIGLCTMMSAANYGSSLVAYSVYKILESLNKSILMIDKQIWSGGSNKEPHVLFAQKHYPNISRKFKIKDDHTELNNFVDTFVVGSDTLWWWNDIKNVKNFFWLDFAFSNKKKISFCTSFAQNNIDIPKEKYQELKYLYSRFDSISTREESGVKNLKNIFGVENAIHLYDPTFVVNPAIFEELAAESKRTDKNYIVAYLLDITLEKEEALKHIAKLLGKELKVIPRMCYKKKPSRFITDTFIPVEDFIYLLKNADFIVSDSFHGTCFSIIFEKPFYTFINNARGAARWQIFKNMDLTDRLIDNISLFIENKEISTNVDFSSAKTIVEKERDKAIHWIKNALEKPTKEPAKEDLLFDYIISEREWNNIPEYFRYAKKMFKKIAKIIKWLIRKIFRI